MEYNTTSYESLYEGGVSSLNPNYGNFAGYRLSASQIGFPGSPQTANQVKDVVEGLKQGTKTFEVTMLNPDTGEGIPKQHFEEMRAIMKLSGVKPSVHGPLIDPAGFGEKGWGGELERQANERRMFDVVKKAQRLDPKGGLPIVFHSTVGLRGPDWRPADKDDLEEERERGFVMEKGVAINRETGEMAQMTRDYKFDPRVPVEEWKGDKGRLSTAESSVGSINLNQWENKITEIAQMNKHAQEIIGNAPENLSEYRNSLIDLNNKKIINFKEENKAEVLDGFSEEKQAESYEQMKKASVFLKNAEMSFAGAFNQAYKYTEDKETLKKLKGLAKEYSEKMKEFGGEIKTKNGDSLIRVWNPIDRQMILSESVEELQKITGDKPPEIYQEAEEFAMDKTSDTFGNLAMKSYEEFDDKAPVIAIENLYHGMAFSRAEDMKKLVEESRNKFAEKLVLEKGIDEDKALDIAKKHIGVTWDVGHLNLMRKAGFSDKDVIEQTKIIKDDVKHLHLTDNFGYADTHLAPGMGNVPIKEILQELEKTGRLGEMKKIVEAGGLVQHFGIKPHSTIIGAFGSPIYGMKSTTGWNHALDVNGSYYGGYGTINPSHHHNLYGAGFTTLPMELGGQVAGQSRMGGTPMA